MKTIHFLPIFLTFVFFGCSSVRVNTDYDKNANFTGYKSYAFYKSGIDKVEISDLDKKRIMRAIDETMTAKGFSKSENPDLLINIFTKARQQVDVNTFNSGWGYGWGWGWNPWMYGGNTSVNTYTEGTLFIDLIDAKKKELIWQGEGEGVLTKDTEKKEKRIQEFVAKILAQYPPKEK
ncbi:DUF4136 domain-containing protein [Flavobacterium selenitireducens]|uniref:DUF4136 domain-containing protein n=1 Tax=Flavobacterium selenitireducens TaxID=2722704 RepID=UPI00168A75FC|nr:DUF4136 domain-containing protein [Flavobacterium selenitireducens]MBD3583375.1 DUF4136 domain-containing protein [Flavobacterium selenitireducens]